MYVGHEHIIYFIVGSETMRSSFVSSVFFFKSVHSYDMLYRSEKASLHFGRFHQLHKNHQRMDRVFAQVTIQGVWSFCLGGRVEADHCIRTYVR